MIIHHRHDLDKKIPRTKQEILELNHKITTSLQEAFRDENNKTIPIVPCIGIHILLILPLRQEKTFF